jgi:TIR domain-containing protein
MSHIFISYSTLDADYAYQLVDKLREEGFNIWIDNAELRSSDNWWEEIVKALRGADAIIPIMTQNSRDSRWVQREVTLADEWGIRPFPLLLDDEKFEIYVLTQFTDVRDAKLPSDNFYIDLEKAVTRQSGRGKSIMGELGLSPRQRMMRRVWATLAIVFIIALGTWWFIRQNTLPTTTLLTRTVSTPLRVEASASGINATIITRVSRNLVLEAVAYTEENGSIWYLVEIPERPGEYGWVRETVVKRKDETELLSIEEIANPLSRFPIPLPTIPTVFITSRGAATPLRSEPSSIGGDETLIIRVDRGISLLAVADSEPDGVIWYLVEIPSRDGEYAWVNQDIVDFDSDIDSLLAYSEFPEDLFVIPSS